MKKCRGLIACTASIIALSLALAPMLAQAQMSGSSGCGHMDSMGYGQTGAYVQPAPHGGWTAPPSTYEHASPQPVQAKSGTRGHGAKKKDHRGHSGPAVAGQGEHAGPAPEHVNQTAPPVM